jgi:hypothetical protein
VNIEQGISNYEVFIILFSQPNNSDGQIYYAFLKIECPTVLRHSLFLVRYSAVQAKMCQGMCMLVDSYMVFIKDLDLGAKQ